MNRHRARRVTAGLTLIVSVSMVTVACGKDDSPGVQTDGRNNGRGSGSGSTTSDTAPSAYVGLTKKAAIAQADANDVTWRILREDDEQFPATLDYNPERINFEIDNGKVTKATPG